jgi:hypothetical protein
MRQVLWQRSSGDGSWMLLSEKRREMCEKLVHVINVDFESEL